MVRKIIFSLFFILKKKVHLKLNHNKIFKSHNYLRNKTLDEIKFSQKIATENVFLKKKFPLDLLKLFIEMKNH